MENVQENGLYMINAVFIQGTKDLLYAFVDVVEKPRSLAASQGCAYSTRAIQFKISFSKY